MADFVQVQRVYALKINVNVLSSGTAETYYLRTQDRNEAIQWGAKLAKLRAYLLPQKCSIPFARIYEVGAPRDASAVIEGPLSFGMAGRAAPNTAEDAMHYRLETVDGEWANRYLHGIPDEFIATSLYTGTNEYVQDMTRDKDNLTYNNLVSILPDGGAGESTKRQAFFANLLELTVLLRVKVENGQPVKLIKDWHRLIRRGPLTRKIGRPFEQSAGRRSVSRRE